MTTPKKRYAFTLIELLVVIAILALLMAIMVPGINIALERGRRTGCKNNIRQIGAAMIQHADNNDGWLVLAGRGAPTYQGGVLANQWPFRQHITNLNASGLITDPRIWVCPSDRMDGVDATARRVQSAANFTVFNSLGNCSYMYVAGYNINKSRENPSTAPVLADESNDRENGSATPGQMPDIIEEDNHGAEYRNVLYLDGHVANVEGNNSANAIFDTLQNSQILQSVD